LTAGGWWMRNSDLLSSFTAGLLVLTCSLVPPLIAPSYLSAGTLLCFLVGAVVGVFALVAVAKQMVEGIALLILRNQKRRAQGARVI